MFEDFIQFLAGLVSKESYGGVVPLPEVLRNLVYSFIGLEKAAHDLQEMEQFTRLQVDVFLATLRSGSKTD